MVVRRRLNVTLYVHCLSSYMECNGMLGLKAVPFCYDYLVLAKKNAAQVFLILRPKFSDAT